MVGLFAFCSLLIAAIVAMALRRTSWLAAACQLALLHNERLAYINCYAPARLRVCTPEKRLTFDGTTGALLNHHSTAPVAGIQRFLTPGHTAVAGMDLMLLALAGFCLLAARRIRRADPTAEPDRQPNREERQRA